MIPMSTRLQNLGIRASLYLGFGAMLFIFVLIAAAALLATEKVSDSLNYVLEEKMPSTIEVLRVAKAVDALNASAAPLGFILTQKEASVSFTLVEKNLNALKEALDALDTGIYDVKNTHSLVSQLEENLLSLRGIVEARLKMATERTQLHQRALLNLQVFQQQLVYRIRILLGDSAILEQLLMETDSSKEQIYQLASDISRSIPITRFYGEIESIHGELLLASQSITKEQLHLNKDVLSSTFHETQLTYKSLPKEVAQNLSQAFSELQGLILADNGIVAKREAELTLFKQGQMLIHANRDIGNKIEFETEQLVADGLASVEQARVYATETKNDFFIVLALITFFGLTGLGLMMYFHINKNIIARLSWLSRSMQEVAAGQLDVDLPPKGDCELGRLASALHLFKQTQIEAVSTENQLRKMNLESEKARVLIEKNAEELRVANKKLAELSVHDSLTGLFNRRHFDEALQHEWDRSGHALQPLALLMIDIDDFKKYNDLYGHQAGDSCLQQVANVIKDCAKRASDIAARYGGEEFCVIAAYTGQAKARQLAEEIRMGVENLSLQHEGSFNGVVTISVGLAVSTLKEYDTPENFLRAADKALYLAKGEGRNCVREFAFSQ